MKQVKRLLLFSWYHATIALALLTWGLLTVPAWGDANTRSSSIALNERGSRLFNVNLEANSVTVFSVGPNNALNKVDEVPVGREPVCVAVSKPQS